MTEGTGNTNRASELAIIIVGIRDFIIIIALIN